MQESLKPIRTYLSYCLRRPWLFLSMFLFGPAVVIQNIVSPLFVARALGQLAQTGHADIHNVIYAGLAFAGGALLWYVVDQYFSVRFHSRTMEDMYNDCLDHLLKQEYTFFTDNFSGSLVTQANRFVKAYDIFHVSFFLDFWGQICTVLTAIAITIWLSPLVGLSIGLVWLLSFMVIIYLVLHRMPIRRRAVAIESVQTGELADTLTNTVTVETFAGTAYELDRYATINTKRKKAFVDAWHVGIRNNLLVAMFGAGLQVVLLITGIKAVEAMTISFATFLLFQLYVVRIIDSLHKSLLSLRFFEGAIGDAHEMADLLDRQPKILDPAEPEQLKITEGAVAFNDVDFGYNEDGSGKLFHNFHLDIAPGERVGLVGPSGGGKTSITRLLLRFHDVQSGSISIDNQAITSVTQADLHRAIAYVPQEPLMFHRTLAENITYGNPRASREQIITAAKQAHAHEFIIQLPEGYDTLVGERGVKLSGGQRQRVAIARAMLKDAPILLLDEATSALDSESEKHIQAALQELMKGRTTLVIAHRLSTIQRMDRIVVLDKGKIVEQGTHKQLLAKKGLYAKLWSHQSGGFIEE